MPELADEDLEKLPGFLMLADLSMVPQISRNTAYDLARQFVSSDGLEGLPVVRSERPLRVPRRRLEQWHGGPLTLRSSSRRRRSTAVDERRHLVFLAEERP